MPKTDAAARFSTHRTCQTLTGLTVEHLPRDGALGRIKRFRKGTDIWRPDDRANRIYFLQRGQVAVMTGDPQGHEVIMRVIEVGEPFGELCFCAEEKGVHHNSARAVIETEALEIKLSDFMGFLQGNVDALTASVFTFCVRLSDCEHRNEVLTHRGAEQRLGGLLLQLAVTRGRPNSKKKSEVLLHISHDELAQMAAMSRSHVTVTMGKLRHLGIVHYERNRPLAVNVPSLKARLTGDYPDHAEEKRRKE